MRCDDNAVSLKEEEITMYLPFVCNGCNKDKWMVIYDTETRGHVLQCANCGKRLVLEEVFGSKKSSTPKRKSEPVKAASEVKEDVAIN